MNDKVAVVGCGLIGRSWAISFSRAGYDVALYDAVPGAAESALGFVDAVLADLHRNGLLSGNEPSVVRARIKIAATLADAVHDAIHVQENTPERLDMKIKIFWNSTGLRRRGRCWRVRPRRFCRHILPRVCRGGPLSGDPSDQSALPCSGCRSGARAMDGRRGCWSGSWPA